MIVTGGEIAKIDATKAYDNIIDVMGNPVIGELKLGNTIMFVGVMEAGASVRLNANGVVSLAFENAAAAEAAAAYFTTVSDKLQVMVSVNNELEIRNPNAVAGECEHCGGVAYWEPWDGISSTGHYFLTEDVTLTDGHIVVSSEMVIDLRGYTITAAENNRVFYVQEKANLVVMDTSAAKTGMITGGHQTRGGNIYIEAKGSFTLYSGIIAGGIADNDLGTTTTNGRGGNIFSNGNVTLLGGAVIDGQALNGSGYGGNIMITGLSATLTVANNAVISGGEAKRRKGSYRC